MNPPQAECIPFVVDETPYACWEWNTRQRNLEFLRGIDGTYHAYVADTNLKHLDGEHRHQAALSLRLAYSQGLETLFALISALIQAPECVIGWLLAYRNVELETLVSKLLRGSSVYSRLRIPPTWDNLSHIVHQHLSYDTEKKTWITHGFAKAWGMFAHDFIDVNALAEYNSVKHGLRARLGGFILMAGVEEIAGQPAASDAMKHLGGSEYGTSFYAIEKLGEGRTNFRTVHQSRNWLPESLFHGLHLLSMSITNIVGCLRILNGESPSECL